MTMAQTWFALAAIVVAVGCGGAKGGDDAGGATVSVAEGTVLPENDGAPIDTVSPYEGVWDIATVRGHLARAGVAMEEDGEIRQSFMGARGVRLRGEPGELQVFVYADAGARARDTDRLDSTALIVPTGAGGMQRPASVVTANNVAVIVVGPDSALLRAVTDVLKAGRD